jgi:hypothetical protein
LKKVLRYIFRIIAVFLGLLILAWLLLVGYVLLKKPDLLKKVSTEIKDRTGGDGSIGDIDISYFRHFPYVTLHLSKVILHDSLWQIHHHDLLKAENVDLRISLFSSLFAGRPRVDKIFLQQGSIYLFTDSTGYTNTSMLHQRDSTTTDKREMKWPEISLADMKFVMERQDKKKLFDFDIRQLNGHIEKNNRTLFLELSTDMQVNSFSFNTEKGSFLKNKSLSGHLRLQFNTASKILQFNKQSLQIAGHSFLFSGRFFPEVSPDPFFLSIETQEISYKQATALLTPILQQKLDQYDIDKPVSVNVTLDAGSADDHTPQINIRMNLIKGSVSTPIGRFSETSFNASFTNEWIHGHKREDENSGLRLLLFSGNWSTIPLRADTITITNLKHPLLSSDLHSKLELTKLNELTGSRSIQFRKGMGELNITCRAPLSGNDSTAVSINGSLNIDSATVDYVPYRFLLTDCNGKIRFRDQDLLIDRLEAHAGSTKVSVKGVAQKLVSLIDKNPGNVSINWTLTTPRLNVGDFTSLAGKPVQPVPSETGKRDINLFGGSANRLDRLLSDGTIHLQLEAADLRYKSFSGAHAKAELLFSGNEIKLNNMEIQQGSGSLTLSGNLHRTDDGGPNPVNLQSHMEQVDLPGIFSAFSNFGQKALLDKNLKGKLTADVHMTGQLTDKAALVQNSLKGTVNFSVKGGQLLDFDPMEKLQETVLKKRDFSEIHFSELKNQLDLDTTTLTIHRMEIQSTAFTLFVEGLYDWKTGADMSLQLPLSNLKKDRNPDIPPDNKGTDSKTGISLRLRAKTQDDGKLKISWDPFKKALKAPRAPRQKARH